MLFVIVIYKSDAYISGKAMVEGRSVSGQQAKVFGNAIIHGFAQVDGSAEVYGDALIHQSASVCGNALVFGDTRIGGNMVIAGDVALQTGEYDWVRDKQPSQPIPDQHAGTGCGAEAAAKRLAAVPPEILAMQHKDCWV